MQRNYCTTSLPRNYFTSDNTCASSVRRIFERGGPGNSKNLRIMKTKMKIFPQNRSVFLPKSGEDQKKKGLHSNLVWFLAQNWVNAKKKVFAHHLCAQTFCPSHKGGGPCRNFVYYSTQITLSWQHKGGPWQHAPP